MTSPIDNSYLLKNLLPKLNDGQYVYCSVSNNFNIKGIEIIALIQESEGKTIVVKKEIADDLNLHYTIVMGWITLTVISSLESIGLSSIVSTKLANNNISCNIISGYYHDHIFVPHYDGVKAIKLLNDLSLTSIELFENHTQLYKNNN